MRRFLSSTRWKSLSHELDFPRQWHRGYFDGFQSQQLLGLFLDQYALPLLVGGSSRRFGLFLMAVAVPMGVWLAGGSFRVVVPGLLAAGGFRCAFATRQHEQNQPSQQQRSHGWAATGLVVTSGSGNPVSNSNCWADSSASRFVSSKPFTASRYCRCNST